MTAPNPFTDPAIAVDPRGCPLDAVEAWETAPYDLDVADLRAAGDRLAKHATSLRGWVEQLERDDDLARQLLDRAARIIDTEGNYHAGGVGEWLSDVTDFLAFPAPDPPENWQADAERVLAAGTGDE